MKAHGCSITLEPEPSARSAGLSILTARGELALRCHTCNLSRRGLATERGMRAFPTAISSPFAW